MTVKYALAKVKKVTDEVQEGEDAGELEGDRLVEEEMAIGTDYWDLNRIAISLTKEYGYFFFYVRKPQ